MKRLTPFLALLVLFSFAASPLWAVLGAATQSEAVADKSPASPYAKAISTVTGIAISPLLGTGALGVYESWKAKTPEEKAKLPWYAQWTFYVPALLIVGLCAAKDSFGAAMPPGLKKPFDVLETI